MIKDHEIYLTHEDAKRLAELGFDWGNNHNSIFYPEDGSEECPDGVWAPRVSLVMVWLFNKHNMIVTVDPWVHDLDPERISYTFKYIIRCDDGNNLVYFDSPYDYYDPMTALTFGVKRCIKLLTERNVQSN